MDQTKVLQKPNKVIKWALLTKTAWKPQKVSLLTVKRQKWVLPRLPTPLRPVCLRQDAKLKAVKNASLRRLKKSYSRLSYRPFYFRLLRKKKAVKVAQRGAAPKMVKIARLP